MIMLPVLLVGRPPLLLHLHPKNTFLKAIRVKGVVVGIHVASAAASALMQNNLPKCKTMQTSKCVGVRFSLFITE